MIQDTSFLIAQAAPIGTGSATTAPAPTAPAGTPAQPQNPMSSLLFPIVIIAVFYLFLIRPQQKRDKERKEMIKALGKNDRVITRGGLVGVVVGLREEEGVAVVKIAENTKVEVLVSAIEAVNPNLAEIAAAAAPKGKAPAKEPKKKAEENK